MLFNAPGSSKGVNLLEKKFEAKAIYLAPISASLAVAFTCNYLILRSGTTVETITPLPDAGLGALVNALLFVALVAMGAGLIYLVMRRFGLNFVNLLIGCAFTITVFLLSTFYMDIIFEIYGFAGFGLEVTVLATLITFFADYCIFILKKHSCGFIIIGVGGALGALLGASIPTFSVFLILAFLSIYDVFAVFRGPVGKIAEEGLSKLRGISLSFLKIEIGLGDLTFYALFATHVLTNFGLVPAFSVASGILVGCYLSFKMLERKRFFPGLPFAIGLGFLFMAVTLMVELLV